MCGYPQLSSWISIALFPHGDKPTTLLYIRITHQNSCKSWTNLNVILSPFATAHTFCASQGGREFKVINLQFGK